MRQKTQLTKLNNTQMKKPRNFTRFYACLKGIQTADKDDLKESLVRSYTNGRTSSLREMSIAEYNAMCDSIDPKMAQSLKDKALIKSQRSAVLRRMQLLGVDTTDWNAVDRFCLDHRIAGKKFYELNSMELKALIPKLIAISKKKKDESRVIPTIPLQQLEYALQFAQSNQIPN